MIINKIIHKIGDLPIDVYSKVMTRKQKQTINSQRTGKRLYLFCAPIHSNLGDQAQLLCWLRLFAIWYPDYEVVKVSTRYRSFDTMRSIKNSLQSDDLLFVHSGYLFFDPHPELPFILDVVRVFFDHPITILPQTVNIMSPWMQDVIGRELDMHKCLTLMCRDEVSLERAKKLFSNVHLQLMPDVVTSLIGNKDFSAHNTNRKGVIFCLRNDLEKHYSDNDLNQLIGQFSYTRTKRRDTTIDAKPWKWNKQREKMIRDIIDELATYEVAITDRYHGTILSAIANTPVIVINSADHKLSSGVKWFDRQVYGNAVQYAATLEEAASMAKELTDKRVKVDNPPYFFEKYWKSKITPPLFVGINRLIQSRKHPLSSTNHDCAYCNTKICA